MSFYLHTADLQSPRSLTSLNLLLAKKEYGRTLAEAALSVILQLVTGSRLESLHRR